MFPNRQWSLVENTRNPCAMLTPSLLSFNCAKSSSGPIQLAGSALASFIYHPELSFCRNRHQVRRTARRRRRVLNQVRRDHTHETYIHSTLAPTHARERFHPLRNHEGICWFLGAWGPYSLLKLGGSCHASHAEGISPRPRQTSMPSTWTTWTGCFRGPRKTISRNMRISWPWLRTRLRWRKKMRPRSDIRLIGSPWDRAAGNPRIAIFVRFRVTNKH